MNLGSAAHGVDDATELDQDAVACALYHLAVMHRDGRIDQITPQRPQPRESAVLLGACETAIPHHICGENGRKLARLCHFLGDPALATEQEKLR